MIALLLSIVLNIARAGEFEMKPAGSVELITNIELQEKISIEAFDVPGAKVHFAVGYRAGAVRVRRMITPQQFAAWKKGLRSVLRTYDEGACDRPFAWSLVESGRTFRYKFCAEQLSEKRRRRLESLSNTILSDLKKSG